VKNKEIYLGTYEYNKTPKGHFKRDGVCGTNHWDTLIKRNDLVGIELEVILRKKRRATPLTITK